MVLLRIISYVIFIVSITTLPWWFTALCMIVAVFYFPSYYEVLFFGLIYDLLFSIPVPYFFSVQFMATIFSGCLLLSAFFLKERLFLIRR